MERLLAGLKLDRERVMKMAEQHVTLHGAFLSGDLPAAQRAIREHVGFGRDLAVEAIELAGGAR
jgi:DNA-binding GntR family transcriptional regulator